MEEEILKKIEEQDKKLEAIYRSVEKNEKVFSLDVHCHRNSDYPAAYRACFRDSNIFEVI